MGLSISIATGLYGISFGALAVAAGLSVVQAVAISLLMFTGGSQFAVVGVIGGGGGWPSAITEGALLGIRNAIYGIQMNELLRPAPRVVPLMAQVTIDESMATASAQTDPDEQRRGFWTAGVGIWILWTAFTLVGALAGDALGDPKRWGLDGAAVAAFLGLLWPRLHGRGPIEVAVLCGVATLVATPFLPAGLPIVLAAVVAALIARVHHGRGADEEVQS